MTCSESTAAPDSNTGAAFSPDSELVRVIKKKVVREIMPVSKISASLPPGGTCHLRCLPTYPLKYLHISIY